MNRGLVLGILAGIGGLALAAPEARAGLLPVNVSINSESSNFRWTYAIVLPSDVQIRKGDYFTIYDFAGFQAGSNSQPAGWSFSTNNVGPVPAGIAAVDNPALPNLTWQYTGSNVDGQVGLGNFWAVSQYDGQTTSNFTSSAHSIITGQPDNNVTSTSVPVPAPPVPEPATLALAAFGLPILGLWRSRRRRKASAQTAGTAFAG